MQHLDIYSEDAGDGITNVVIEGSTDAFMWLAAAAGNARDGFDKNQADATTGEPLRLVLRPQVPNSPRDQLPKRRTAHLEVRHAAAKKAAHIPIDQAAYDALDDVVRAELNRRGVLFAVKEPEVGPASEALEARAGGPTGAQPAGDLTGTEKPRGGDPANPSAGYVSPGPEGDGNNEAPAQAEV